MKRGLALGAAALVALAMVTAGAAAADAPSVTSVAPASGPPLWSVTLAGSGLSDATSVTFVPTVGSYSPEQADFVAEDDSTIVATVPAIASGPTNATIVVATPEGEATTPGYFAVAGDVSVSEHRGCSGEPVTLTGSSFTGATQVTFGTWPLQLANDQPFALVNAKLARFHIVSDSKITATVPTLAVGRSCCVQVAGPQVTSVSGSSSFIVVRPELLRNAEGTFAIRPRTVVPSVDGSFSVTRIRWRLWAPREALGSGTVWIDNGVPNMALGTYHHYAGALTAYRVRGGRYTRLAIRWREGSRRKMQRLRLTRGASGSGWFWS